MIGKYATPLVSIILSALALYFVVGMPTVWDLAGPADQGVVVFPRLERPATPNTYLVCPENVCAAPVDAPSPTFECSAGALYQRALAVMDARGTEEVDRDDGLLQARFVERTRFMEFPDTISIRAYPAGPATSQVAIYSRSLVGRGDFGVNGKRVNKILSDLASCASTASEGSPT